MIKWGVVKCGGSFEDWLCSRFKKWFDVCNFITCRERIKIDREIAKLKYWLSFRNLPVKLSVPAALDGFKSIRWFDIFSDVSENSKFKSLNLILYATIPQNRQTHSNNSSAICRRIV